MTRQPKTMQRSFAGGEVSPQMFGRMDDAKMVNGAAVMRNMIATPQGATYRRSGTQFVGTTKDGSAAHLFEFRYSLGQSLAISGGRAQVDGREIGHFRFYSDGGTLLYDQPDDHLTSATPSTHISGLWTTPVAHGFSTGQPVVVTLAAPATSLAVTFPSVPTTGDQTFNYPGANLGLFGQQIMFDEDGGTLPPNVEPHRLYWLTSNVAGVCTFSETYQGPNVRGSGVASTATIRFSAMPFATLRYRANVVYYVIEVSPTTFRLAESETAALAGDPIATTANGDGEWRVHPAYVPGDAVRWTGVGPGNFYCIRRPWCSAPDPVAFNYCHTADHLGHPPTSVSHWVRLPGSYNASPTIDPVTNTVDWGSAHGFANGLPIVFSAVTMPVGLNAGQVYYVRDVGTQTFSLSATPQGPLLTWSTAGSGVTALAGAYYEVPHNYTLAELQAMTTAQSFDVLTLATPDHAVAELRRLSADRWELQTIEFGAAVEPPEKPFVVEVDRGESLAITNIDAATPRTFTTISTHGFSPTLSVYVEGCTTQGVVDGFYIVDTASGTSFTLKNVDAGNVLGGGTAGAPVVGRVRLSPLGAQIDSQYVVTAIDEDGEESEASEALEVQNLLAVAGAATTIGWIARNAAARYRVYKELNGLFGLIGETDSLQFTDDNIGPDLTITPPMADESLRRTSFVTFDTANDIVNWPGHGFIQGTPVVFYSNDTMPVQEGATFYVVNPSEDAFQLAEDLEGLGVVNIAGPDSGEHWGEGGNFPSAVTYFESRRCFGGSRPRPQDLWMTASGSERDLSFSIPTVASDRIYVRIRSREAAAIEHLIPLSQLLVLTDTLEMRVTPINDDALTPTSISLRPQSYIGAAFPQPSVVNNIVVFAAARGGHLRELGYDREALGYLTGDLSLRAEHLFDNLTILDQAYAKAPLPTIWVVSSNGQLLGLTYIPEEQVGAWHRHDTAGGSFVSVCAVPEGDEDSVYAVVERSGAHYIERMAPRFRGDQADDPTAFFVDFGATYQGPETLAIGGLDHLDGLSVSYLADGIAGTGTVTGGTLALRKAASVVHVGIGFTSRLETVPVFLQIPGFGSAHQKVVNSVTLRVYQSGAYRVGQSGKALLPSRSPAAGSFRTGVVEPVLIGGTWDIDARAIIEQSDPLPLTVVSATIEYTVGG